MDPTQAREFKSPEALNTYLKEHPHADKNKHHVKKDEGGGKKDEGTKKKEPSIEDALRDKFSPAQRREFLKKNDPDHPVLKQQEKEQEKKKDKGEGSTEDALRDAFSPEQRREFLKKHQKSASEALTLRVAARYLARSRG